MTFTTSKTKFNQQLRGGAHNMKKFYFSQKGFTLIELLIVIVIIGILSGVVLTVINPAKQIQRARQTVFRANAEKASLAFQACASSTQDATICGTLVKIGFTDPLTPSSPAVPTYVITPAAVVAGSTVTLTSTYDTCVFTTVTTPSTGVVASNFKLTLPAGANCVLDQ